MIDIIQTSDERIWHLKRTIKERENFKLNEWKKSAHYDIVLRKNGAFFLCNNIEDAIVIDDINKEQ